MFHLKRCRFPLKNPSKAQLPGILASILALSASVAHADPDIIKPTAGETVCIKVFVEGQAKVRDGLRLGVLVQPRGFGNNYWPQNWPVVRQSGKWDTLTFIGNNTDQGLQFRVVAAYFYPAAQAKIKKYFDDGKRTGDWRPIPFPQPAAPNLDEVTVVRGNC